MKRKIEGIGWVSACALFCAGAVFLTGCGAGGSTGQTAAPEMPEHDTAAQPELSENMEKQTAVADVDSAPDSGQDG